MKELRTDKAVPFDDRKKPPGQTLVDRKKPPMIDVDPQHPDFDFERIPGTVHYFEKLNIENFIPVKPLPPKKLRKK